MKPHEQMWIDVGKLIRDRVPDKSGALLPPPQLTMGAYAFQDLTDPTVGNLYEGKVILDKTFGHAAYGCAKCCGMEGRPYMYINPVDLAVSGQVTQQVMDTNTCTNDAEYQPAGSWRTDDSNVATAVNAVVTGVGAGQTTHYAKVFLESITVGNTCQRASPGTSGPVAVCPNSTTTSNLTPLPLSDLFPALKTGIGAEATMQVGPAGMNWNGYQITEAVVRTSNSCPANWTNVCTTAVGPGVVGTGGEAHVIVNGTDTKFGPPFNPQNNIFYDQHTVTDPTSGLSGSGMNQCVVECTQTYFCGDAQVAGSHVITYTFTLGTENGTPVTNVAVAKN